MIHAFTPREAATDALHRAVLGLDTNNRALFASACLPTEEMAWRGGGVSATGWDAVSALFGRVFDLVTIHVVSNVRVVFEGPETARVNAHAVSYHVRPGDEESVEERSFTGYSLYELVVVKTGEGMEGWRIKVWEARVLRTTGERAIVHV